MKPDRRVIILVVAALFVLIFLAMALRGYRSRSKPVPAAPIATAPAKPAAPVVPAERPERRSALSDHERRSLENALKAGPGTADADAHSRPQGRIAGAAARAKAWAERVDAPRHDILGGGGLTIHPQPGEGKPAKGGIFDPDAK